MKLKLNLPESIKQMS